MTKYEIRDPIYGFISLNEWERKIIDHLAFQRLRRIKQLALTDLVYPGANHTRFEHSLGVMHLATLMFDEIMSKSANKRLLEEKLSYQESGFARDRQLIRLGALLHDIGHGPFSHVSDEVMPRNKKTGKPYQHEDYSCAIIRGPMKDIIEEHTINKTNYQISAEDVAAIIEGNPKVLGNRIFWKVLISSQLDADRGDYLLRDSHHLGVKYGIYDYQRLINTLCLGIDPESEEIILCSSEDGLHSAEALVIARYQMFTQVYFHKTRRAYDYHLTEALKTILNKKLPSPKKIDKFLKLDDYDIINEIKRRSKSDENCESIFQRNHIREIYFTADTPNIEDVQKKDEKVQILNDNGIWFYEDEASKLWYKLNSKAEEIMILGNDRVKPLSEYSNVVKNIGEHKKVRIYVKEKDKAKAKQLIN